jgi:hypothetical protein
VLCLNVVHPVVCCNNSVPTEEPVKHNTCIILKKQVRGGYMFQAFKRPSSHHPLNNSSVKSKTQHTLKLKKVDSARCIQTQYTVPVIILNSFNVLHHKTGFVFIRNQLCKAT